MGTMDVAAAVVIGTGAALCLTAGVAIGVRSRQQPHEILWRGQRIPAPRLVAYFYLFMGLLLTTMTLSSVLLERGSNGHGLAILMEMVFVAAAIITGVRWYRRRGKPAQHPMSP